MINIKDGKLYGSNFSFAFPQGFNRVEGLDSFSDDDLVFVSADNDYLSIVIYLKKEKNAIYFAIFCCFLYAISDEIHQLFIVGRNGNVVDVLIDTCGSMFGIFLLLIISKLLHKHV